MAYVSRTQNYIILVQGWVNRFSVFYSRACCAIDCAYIIVYGKDSESVSLYLCKKKPQIVPVSGKGHRD